MDNITSSQTFRINWKAIQIVSSISFKGRNISTINCHNTCIALKFCIVVKNNTILSLSKFAVKRPIKFNIKFWSAQAE